MLTSGARARAQGFTLIELMISIVLGLIVVSAVLGLIVSNLQNANAVTRGVRVTQESRALTEIMTRELRRAGYDGSGMTRIGSGTNATTFRAITILAGPNCPSSGTNCCIKYAYDSNGDGVASAGEFRMFSRDVVNGRGVVRYGRFANAAAVACDGGSVITSSDIDVSCLRFRRATSSTNAITSSSPDACFIPVPSTAVNLPDIPTGDIYFAMNLSLPLDARSTTARRTDGVITLR